MMLKMPPSPAYVLSLVLLLSDFRLEEGQYGSIVATGQQITNFNDLIAQSTAVQPKQDLQIASLSPSQNAEFARSIMYGLNNMITMILYAALSPIINADSLNNVQFNSLPADKLNDLKKEMQKVLAPLVLTQAQMQTLQSKVQNIVRDYLQKGGKLDKPSISKLCSEISVAIALDTNVINHVLSVVSKQLPISDGISVVKRLYNIVPPSANAPPCSLDAYLKIITANPTAIIDFVTNLISTIGANILSSSDAKTKIDQSGVNLVDTLLLSVFAVDMPVSKSKDGYLVLPSQQLKPLIRADLTVLAQNKQPEISPSSFCAESALGSGIPGKLVPLPVITSKQVAAPISNLMPKLPLVPLPLATKPPPVSSQTNGKGAPTGLGSSPPASSSTSSSASKSPTMPILGSLSPFALSPIAFGSKPTTINANIAAQAPNPVKLPTIVGGMPLTPPSLAPSGSNPSVPVALYLGPDSNQPAPIPMQLPSSLSQLTKPSMPTKLSIPVSLLPLQPQLPTNQPNTVLANIPISQPILIEPSPRPASSLPVSSKPLLPQLVPVQSNAIPVNIPVDQQVLIKPLQPASPIRQSGPNQPVLLPIGQYPGSVLNLPASSSLPQLTNPSVSIKLSVPVNSLPPQPQLPSNQPNTMPTNIRISQPILIEPSQRPVSSVPVGSQPSQPQLVPVQPNSVPTDIPLDQSVLIRPLQPIIPIMQSGSNQAGPNQPRLPIQNIPVSGPSQPSSIPVQLFPSLEPNESKTPIQTLPVFGPGQPGPTMQQFPGSGPNQPRPIPIQQLPGSDQNLSPNQARPMLLQPTPAILNAQPSNMGPLPLIPQLQGPVHSIPLNGPSQISKAIVSQAGLPVDTQPLIEDFLKLSQNGPQQGLSSFPGKSGSTGPVLVNPLNSGSSPSSTINKFPKEVQGIKIIPLNPSQISPNFATQNGLPETLQPIIENILQKYTQNILSQQSPVGSKSSPNASPFPSKTGELPQNAQIVKMLSQNPPYISATFAVDNGLSPEMQPVLEALIKQQMQNMLPEGVSSQQPFPTKTISQPLFPQQQPGTASNGPLSGQPFIPGKNILPLGPSSSQLLPMNKVPELSPVALTVSSPLSGPLPGQGTPLSQIRQTNPQVVPSILMGQNQLPQGLGTQLNGLPLLSSQLSPQPSGTSGLPNFGKPPVQIVPLPMQVVPISNSLQPQQGEPQFHIMPFPLQSASQPSGISGLPGSGNPLVQAIPLPAQIVPSNTLPQRLNLPQNIPPNVMPIVTIPGVSQPVLAGPTFSQSGQPSVQPGGSKPVQLPYTPAKPATEKEVNDFVYKCPKNGAQSLSDNGVAPDDEDQQILDAQPGRPKPIFIINVVGKKLPKLPYISIRNSALPPQVAEIIKTTVVRNAVVRLSFAVIQSSLAKIIDIDLLSKFDISQLPTASQDQIGDALRKILSDVQISGGLLSEIEDVVNNVVDSHLKQPNPLSPASLNLLYTKISLSITFNVRFVTMFALLISVNLVEPTFTNFIEPLVEISLTNPSILIDNTEEYTKLIDSGSFNIPTFTLELLLTIVSTLGGIQVKSDNESVPSISAILTTLTGTDMPVAICSDRTMKIPTFQLLKLVTVKFPPVKVDISKPVIFQLGKSTSVVGPTSILNLMPIRMVLQAVLANDSSIIKNVDPAKLKPFKVHIGM